MKKIVLFLFSVLTAVFVLAGCVIGNQKPQEINIIYTSNLHGGYTEDFNYSGLFAYKNDLEEAGGNVLLVDTGNAVNWLPTGNVSDAEETVDIMNKLGYDLAVPGKYELQDGIETLLSLQKKADFSYISSNIISSDSKNVISPYHIFNIGGRNIAFIGVTSYETLPKGFIDENGNYLYSLTSYSLNKDEFITCIQNAADEARIGGADFIILISNIGNSSLSSLDLENLKIDAVIEDNGQNSVGIMTISPDGIITSDTISELAYEDVNISSLIDIKKAEFTQTLEEILATSDFPLITSDLKTGKTVITKTETNLGNLIADAYKTATNSDIAIIGKNELNAGFDKGNITYENLASVLSKDGFLNTVKITGAQIIDLLEIAFNDLSGDSENYLQVSGLSLTLDLNNTPNIVTDENGVFLKIDGNNRVKNVFIGDEAIDLQKTYKLTYSSFVPEIMKKILEQNTFIIKDSIHTTSAVANYIKDTLGAVINEKYAYEFGENRITSIPLGQSEPYTSPSYIPQVYITVTGNEKINRSDYISCSITIHDPKGVYDDIFDAESTIKIRGNSTSKGEKAPYNIKFSSKQEVLGLGKGKKWSLLANMYDKTQVRNMLAYNFATEIGVNYVSNSSFAEVYLNGEYRGIYQICEPVDVSKTQVDIDIDNNEYLMEIEPYGGYSNNYYITTPVLNIILGYNEPEEPTSEQRTWLRDFLKKAENALVSGDYEKVKEYFDVESFARNYIVQELFKQVDYNTSSTRFYIKEGKLYEGPIWDFDLSSGNVSNYYYPNYNNVNTSKLSYQGLNCVAIYNKHLFKYDEFEELVKALYKELQPQIVNLYKDNELGRSKLDSLLDEYYDEIERNNSIWSVKEKFSSYEHKPIGTYDGEIDYLRDWLKNRNEWLYNHYCK